MSKPTTIEKKLEPVARFESAMKELEQLVQALERGDQSLEDSLKSYEKGMALSDECRLALETAELKIKTLTQKGDAES